MFLGALQWHFLWRTLKQGTRNKAGLGWCEGDQEGGSKWFQFKGSQVQVYEKEAQLICSSVSAGMRDAYRP